MHTRTAYEDSSHSARTPATAHEHRGPDLPCQASPVQHVCAELPSCTRAPMGPVIWSRYASTCSFLPEQQNENKHKNDNAPWPPQTSEHPPRYCLCECGLGDDLSSYPKSSTHPFSLVSGSLSVIFRRCCLCELPESQRHSHICVCTKHVHWGASGRDNVTG